MIDISILHKKIQRYVENKIHIKIGYRKSSVKNPKGVIFPMGQQPPVGQGLLIIEASLSHSDTHHTLGLLWTSDQPDAETST
jgi:hypothetical protein